MSVEIWLGLCLQVAASVPSSPAFPTAIHPTGVPGEVPPEVTLVTLEGQSMKGRLRPSAKERFGLGSSGFAEPLIIRPDRIATMSFVADEPYESSPEGRFEFVLNDGSHLQGQLLEIAADSWQIKSNGMGTLRVPAESIVSADNLGGAASDGPGLVYRGPTGLLGWSRKDSDNAWEVESDSLMAKKAKAQLSRDLGLDRPRDVTLELRWEGDPHFRLFIGAKSSALTKIKVLTVEPWGKSLVAWRSDKDGMQIAEITHGLEANSTYALRFQTDDENITFLDAAGAELCQMPRSKSDGPRLNLISDTAKLELANVRVFSRIGDSQAYQRLQADEITGIEDDGQRFTTATESVERATLLGVDVRDAPPAVARRAGDLWLEYGDGRRIGGAFQRVTETGLEILPAWAHGPIVAEWGGLRRAYIHGHQAHVKRRRSSRSFLVTSQGEVAGELESISPQGEIRWNASIAEGSSTLSMDSAERVVINRTTAYYVSGRKFPHLMQLRNGDRFRCVVHSITGDSILFSSPFGKAQKVQAELVKAVEFDLRATARFAKLFAAKPKPQGGWYAQPKEARRETSEGFDADSLERALALPRKYKTRQFEHLVLARNGDFLRTNLVGLSPEGAVYPGVSDVDRLVPKDRLAAVIWLAPPAGEGVEDPVEGAEEDPEGEPNSTPTTPVRVVMDEHTSLSMNLSSTEDGTLIGSSSVLGRLQIQLPHILSIELAPKAVHIESAYSKWVLKPMKEPFPDGENDGVAESKPDAQPKGQAKAENAASAKVPD